MPPQAALAMPEEPGLPRKRTSGARRIAPNLISDQKIIEVNLREIEGKNNRAETNSTANLQEKRATRQNKNDSLQIYQKR